MTIATGDPALAADVAAIRTTAASASTEASTALANATSALAAANSAVASIAEAIAGLAGIALSVPSLPVVNSVGTSDTVAIGQNGNTVAATLSTVLNPETIDQLSPANPAADTDTFASGQGSNVLVKQTLASVWNLIASHLSQWHRNVIELTTNTSLDGSVHNNAIVICSQSITLSPSGTMGSRFACDVVNVSGGNQRHPGERQRQQHQRGRKLYRTGDGLFRLVDQQQHGAVVAHGRRRNVAVHPWGNRA